MTTLQRLLVSLWVLCLVALAGCNSTPEQQAISAIQKLGGTVESEADGGIKIDLTGRIVTGNALAPLKDIKHLHTLILTASPVSDADLQHLQGLQELKDLNLNLTKVTDAGMKYLAGLKTLEMLHLVGAKLTDAGLVQCA